MGIFAHMLAGGAAGGFKAWDENIDERKEAKRKQEELEQREASGMRGAEKQHELRLKEADYQHGKRLEEADYKHNLGLESDKYSFQKLPGGSYAKIDKTTGERVGTVGAEEAKEEHRRAMEKYNTIYGDRGGSGIIGEKKPVSLTEQRSTMKDVNKMIEDAGGIEKAMEDPIRWGSIQTILSNIDMEIIKEEIAEPGWLHRLTGGRLGGANTETEYKLQRRQDTAPPPANPQAPTNRPAAKRPSEAPSFRDFLPKDAVNQSLGGNSTGRGIIGEHVRPQDRVRYDIDRLTR